MTHQPPTSPLYTATSFELRHDASVPCVEMLWRGYHTSPAFRQQNAAVMELLIASGATKLLGDIRDFTLIAAEDQAWLNETWLPQATARGLRFAALVTPTFYFNRVAVQTVVDRIPSPTLQVAYFDTPDRARAWLRDAA